MHLQAEEVQVHLIAQHSSVAMEVVEEEVVVVAAEAVVEVQSSMNVKYQIDAEMFLIQVEAVVNPLHDVMNLVAVETFQLRVVVVVVVEQLLVGMKHLMKHPASQILSSMPPNLPFQ